MNACDFIFLLAVKTLILSSAAMFVLLLFRLTRCLSAKLHRTAWCVVLLLGLVGGGVPIPVPISPTDQIDLPENRQIAMSTPAMTAPSTAFDQQMQSPALVPQGNHYAAQQANALPSEYGEYNAANQTAANASQQTSQQQGQQTGRQIPLQQAANDIPANNIFANSEPVIVQTSPQYVAEQNAVATPDLTPDLTPDFAAETIAAVAAAKTTRRWDAFARNATVHVLLIEIWLAGIVAIAGWRLLTYVLLLRRLRAAVPVDAVSQAGFFDQWRQLLARLEIAEHRLTLLFSDKIGPGLVWLPRGRAVVVPRDLWDEASPEIREAILLHELTHYRNGDLRRSGLMRSLATLHWFNPFAWLAVRKLDEAVECLCDAAAFGQDENGPVRFAESMLAVHDASRSILLNRYAFHSGKISRRLRFLQKSILAKKETLMKKIVIVTMLCLVCLAGLCRVRLVAAVTATTQETPPAIADTVVVVGTGSAVVVSESPDTQGDSNTVAPKISTPETITPQTATPPETKGGSYLSEIRKVFDAVPPGEEWEIPEIDYGGLSPDLKQVAGYDVAEQLEKLREIVIAEKRRYEETFSTPTSATRGNVNPSNSPPWHRHLKIFLETLENVGLNDEAKRILESAAAHGLTIDKYPLPRSMLRPGFDFDLILQEMAENRPTQGAEMPSDTGQSFFLAGHLNYGLWLENHASPIKYHPGFRPFGRLDQEYDAPAFDVMSTQSPGYRDWVREVIAHYPPKPEELTAPIDPAMTIKWSSVQFDDWYKRHMGRAVVLSVMGRQEEAKAIVEKMIDIDRKKFSEALQEEATAPPRQSGSLTGTPRPANPTDAKTKINLDRWLDALAAYVKIGELETAQNHMGQIKSEITALIQADEEDRLVLNSLRNYSSSDLLRSQQRTGNIDKEQKQAAIVKYFIETLLPLLASEMSFDELTEYAGRLDDASLQGQLPKSVSIVYAMRGMRDDVAKCLEHDKRFAPVMPEYNVTGAPGSRGNVSRSDEDVKRLQDLWRQQQERNTDRWAISLDVMRARQLFDSGQTEQAMEIINGISLDRLATNPGREPWYSLYPAVDIALLLRDAGEKDRAREMLLKTVRPPLPDVVWPTDANYGVWMYMAGYIDSTSAMSYLYSNGCEDIVMELLRQSEDDLCGWLGYSHLLSVLGLAYSMEADELRPLFDETLALVRNLPERFQVPEERVSIRNIRNERGELLQQMANETVFATRREALRALLYTAARLKYYDTARELLVEIENLPPEPEGVFVVKSQMSMNSSAFSPLLATLLLDRQFAVAEHVIDMESEPFYKLQGIQYFVLTLVHVDRNQASSQQVSPQQR